MASLISALQCNTWFTFSSVPSQIEDYYHLQRPSHGDVNGVIDLLLNWGCIMAFPSIPFTAYILLLPIKGLKSAVTLSCCLVFAGNVIRCIPSILDSLSPDYELSDSLLSTLIFLHFGQILNAIAGVLIMSSPSKLSVIWFPEQERKFATGCLGIAGAMGNGFGFLCGPYLVSDADDVPLMLYLDALLALIPFVCVLCYFPNSPRLMPSRAARDVPYLIPFRHESKGQNAMIQV